MLRFYKDAISPLLQPACRFQPTCSAYAMDAYKKFGVGKGTALTAWRLMRCNPWGGSGYDPVKWPPPGLEWQLKMISVYVSEFHMMIVLQKVLYFLYLILSDF